VKEIWCLISGDLPGLSQVASVIVCW